MPEKLAEATVALGKQIAKVRDSCAVAWSDGPRPVVVEAAGRCDALFGVLRRGLRDKPAGQIFGGGERAARDVAAACAKGAIAEQRLMVRLAGPQAGRQFPAMLAVRALPGGVVAVVRDLTAAPPGADAALRADDLARFASLVAHEVRNPLSSVKITLQSLERGGLLRGLQGLQGQGNDGRRIAIAIREVRNLEQLLSDVQEYARPSSLSMVPVDPLEVVARSVEDLAEEWRARGVAFALEAPRRMPLVQADPARLRAAVQLLGKQAGEAAEEAGGGTVHVGLGTRRRQRWELWVRDPGRTLPAAARAAAFVPFTPSRARGSGLSLAVVRRIAEEHGGEVRYEAAEEGGNVVRLLLPA
jgi:two-component system sensor histidine kinase HydH